MILWFTTVRLEPNWVYHSVTELRLIKLMFFKKKIKDELTHITQTHTFVNMSPWCHTLLPALARALLWVSFRFKYWLSKKKNIETWKKNNNHTMIRIQSSMVTWGRKYELRYLQLSRKYLETYWALGWLSFSSLQKLWDQSRQLALSKWHLRAWCDWILAWSGNRGVYGCSVVQPGAKSPVPTRAETVTCREALKDVWDRKTKRNCSHLL